MTDTHGMHILLIQPPIHPESMAGGTMEPLALEVLGGAIRDERDLPEDTRVEILDLRIESEGALERKLADFKPRIVGITGITMDYPCVMQVLGRVREFAPSVVTVVGGHHATMVPHDFYVPAVDIIVRGQGISSLPRIVRAMHAGESVKPGKGILVREDQSFAGDPDTWDFERVPMPAPDRSLTFRYRRRYRFQGHTWGLLITAQGCPFRCSFCACWKVLDGRYETRAPEAVVEELAAIPEKRVFIGDDHTLGDVRRAERIVDLIKQRGIRKILLGYSRADTIVKHPDLLRKWAEVGLKGLTIGFEALNNAELRRLNKACTVEVNEQAHRILVDYGIDSYAHFLMRPEYDEKDFERIRRYIFDNGIIKPVFPVFTPLPGTALRAECPTVFPDDHQYYDLAHPLTPTKLPPREFYRQVFRLYRANFSFARYLRAKCKRGLNRLFPGRFAWATTQAPDLFFTVVARLWLWNALKVKKFEPFLAKFEKSL